MSPARQRAAAAAVTVAGVLLAFAPVAAGHRTLSRYDTERLYAPVRTLVVEELRAGRLPLWNPYEGTGKPLFAEGLHAVLHPVSLLGAALAPASVDFLVLAYLVSAALGAFALARALGASPQAAAGAGLAFALSGYTVSMTGNLVFLAGLSTLPWVVAAARAAGAGARWGAVLAALAASAAFLAGDAQVALVGLALGLLLAADAGGRRGAVRALAGLVAGVLLAGVQILATREFLPRTYRSLELADWERTRWALVPWRLLEWVLPGLSRGPLSAMPAGTSGRWLDFEFSESVYLGAPLLAAAALGLRSRQAADRRRTAFLLAGAALVLLWLALGHRLGARQALDWVPVWNRFRYAEKLVAPLGLCAAALAALGVDAFGAERLPAAWRRALLGLALAAGAVLLALLAAEPATLDLATRLLGDAGPFYRATLAAALPHLLVALGALLALDRLRGAPARAAALAALVALAPAAALPYAAEPAPREVRDLSAPLRLESDSPTPRLAQPMAPLFDPGESQAWFASYARNERALLFPAYNVARRLDVLGAYDSFQPRRITTFLRSVDDPASPARRPAALRRLALTHVVFPTPTDEASAALVAPLVEGGRPAHRDERLGIEIWAVPHRPWAFFAAGSVARPRPQDAHRALLDLMARGDEGTVVVEAAEAPPTAPGRVLRVERGTATVRIEAEGAGPGLLVVQDAWWPGWRAAVDGRPAEILTADLVVRAVRWPAGRHVLEMTYEPEGVRLGLWVSAAGAVAVLALALAAARGARTGPPGRGTPPG